MSQQSTGTQNRDPQDVASIFQAGLAYPSVYDKLIKVFSQYTLTYIPHAMSNVNALPMGAQKDTWFVKGRREDPIYCTGGYSGTGSGFASATVDLTAQTAYPTQVLILPSGTQIQLLDGGTPSTASTGGYTYTYKIATYNSSDTVTGATDFAAGTLLGNGWSTSTNKSKTGYGSYKQPDSYTNFTSITRRTVSIDGTAATQLLYLKDEKGNPMVSFPMQYADEKDSFMYDKEKKLWFAKSNVNPVTGITSVTDAQGNPLPQGAGFTEQVDGINADSYTGSFTTQQLRDYFYQYMVNASITTGSTVLAVTGHNGANKWESAMNLDYRDNSSTLRQAIIGGKDVDLGNFYPSFKIGDVTVKLVINPLFDDPLLGGAVNDDGSTKLSNSFYFINLTAGIDNSPTLTRMYKAAGGIDRSLIEKPQPGLINPMGSLGTFNFATSGYDGYEVHLLSEEMLEVKNPVACGSFLQN